MTIALRRAAALTAAALACALPAGSAQAAPSTENVATAVVQEDGGRAFDFAWDLSTEKRLSTVDHLNKAFARGICIRCSATAIAFQVVLVTGTPTPTTVIPVNIADGQNILCLECVTVAEARQFVRVVPDSVKFTDAGRAVLADVRERLRALETQDLPVAELHAVIEAQEARVREVLNTQLVLRSAPGTEAEALQQRSLQAADLS